MARPIIQRRRDYFVEVVEEEQGTAASSIAKPVTPDATRMVAALLTEDADQLRHRAHSLNVDVGKTHQKTYESEWRFLTQQRGAQSPVDVLNELGDLGFAWRDIARMVGVTVPAVQKWRRGERITGPNRLRVASLMAACDFLKTHYYINDEDLPSWFEMPLTEAAPITPIDIWAAGMQVVFFDYATRHATVDETLDKFDPEWRECFRTDIESFRDSDGNLGLRMMNR
jgi:hypothetical protein